MFSDLDRRQVETLPPLHPGDRPTNQGPPTPARPVLVNCLNLATYTWEQRS